MMKKTVFVSIPFFILFILLWNPLEISAAKKFSVGSPSRAIQDLDDLLDDYIVSAKTLEEKEFNRRLKKQALEGTFDIRRLGRLAMSKHWDEISRKEQNHFVDVLSQLLERKAVFAKEQGSGKKKKKTNTSYRVSYNGHKFLDSEKKRALVNTWVHIPSENLKIALNYKLHQVKGSSKIKDPILGKKFPASKNGQEARAWKIYDVIVDGASLLDNYKYQFDNIIRKNGYENLIRRMEAKLTGMKQKEADEKATSE